MYVGIKQLLQHRSATASTAKYAAIALTIAVLAIAIAYEMHPFGFAAGAADEPACVVVHKGDTLWDLARTYGPPTADPRQTIARIREVNHLSTSLIRPGETVIIPQS